MRWAQFLLLALAVSCGGKTGLDEQTEDPCMARNVTRNIPWLMWGNSQIVTVNVSPPVVNIGLVNSQLIQIQYDRPDMWRFLLFANIISSDLTGAPAAVACGFNVTTGLGRSSSTIQRFEIFEWENAAISTQVNQRRFSTSAYAGPRTAQAIQQPNQVELIPGQDIQINADVSVLLATGGTFLTMEVAAYLTPNCHIRPEWFAKVAEVDAGQSYQDFGPLDAGDGEDIL